MYGELCVAKAIATESSVDPTSPPTTQTPSATLALLPDDVDALSVAKPEGRPTFLPSLPSRAREFFSRLGGNSPFADDIEIAHQSAVELPSISPCAPMRKGISLHVRNGGIGESVLDLGNEAGKEEDKRTGE